MGSDTLSGKQFDVDESLRSRTMDRTHHRQQDEPPVSKDELFDRRMMLLLARDEALIARIEMLTTQMDRLVALITKSVTEHGK